jgi:phosphoribosylformylglycinamidine cyclo-ligase
VSADKVAAVTERLEAAGETVFPVGRIDAGEKGCTVCGSVETWSAKSDWSATHLG